MERTASPVRKHEADEWVPLREYMMLRVQHAETKAEAIESRTLIKFMEAETRSEIERQLNAAKFREHNTALEQNAKLAQTAAVAQEKQASEFARKGEVMAEMRALAKQVEDLKLSRQETVGIDKGSEGLRRIGMMIVAALVTGIVVVVVGGIVAAIKLGGA